MKVGVVIPSSKVKSHIQDLVSRIGPEVSVIYIVDDACPEKTGLFVEQNVRDSRVKVIYHEKNLGVGGAVLTGYRQAYQDKMCDVVVKLDGDGQMDPSLVSLFIKPIVEGRADYTKGNRYFALENLTGMPALRLLGNACLSFVSKVSTGYWSVMDPTNGFTAIHVNIIGVLPMAKISQRYFFESDILFRLNCLKAVVKDVPMKSKYGEEKSHLNIAKTLVEFPPKHILNFAKRIFYNYFLRDFSIGSVQLLVGFPLLVFGVTYGVINWEEAFKSHQLTPTGKIFLAALPVLVGVQLLISALNYDIESEPRDTIYDLL